MGLKHRVVKSLLALFVREGIIKAIGFLANILLARLLLPEIFGIYAVVCFVMAFFSIFTDVGLGAALIQKKEEVGEEDFRTVFSIQFFLVNIIVFIIFVFAPYVVKIYKISFEAVWFIRILSLNFFIKSFKTIPFVKLEKKLKFESISIAEVCEVLAFQVIAVAMAFLGYGVWSFIMAGVFSALVNVAIIYYLSPWSPRFGYNKKSAIKFFSFGWAYQASSIIDLIKNNIVPTVVALLYGAKAVGYVNWAQGLALSPYVIIRVIDRINFPLLANLQNDNQKFKMVVEKAIKMSCMFMFPVLSMLIALAPQITIYIYTSKWMPGLPSVYYFSIMIFTSGITSTISSALYAMGKPQVALKILIISTVAVWLICPPFIKFFGYNGYAMGMVVVNYTTFWIPIYMIKKEINIEIIENILPSFIASIIVGGMCYFAAKLYIKDLFSLIAVFALSFAGYILMMICFFDKNLFSEIKELTLSYKFKEIKS